MIRRDHDVRFGSKADIRACSGDVRFTPESGHRNRPAYYPSMHELQQLGDIRRDPPRFDFGEQLGRDPPRFGRMYAGGAGSICT